MRRRLIVVFVSVLALAGVSVPGSANHPNPPPPRRPTWHRPCWRSAASWRPRRLTPEPGPETLAPTWPGERWGPSFPPTARPSGSSPPGSPTTAGSPTPKGNLGTELGGTSKLNGRDLTQLRVNLNAPAGTNYISFDFAFYSEEFPEFIGSSFNDVFVAEIGASNITASGNQVAAPNNFVKDPNGNMITVNNAFGVTAENAAGTTYDGATPRLKTQTAINSGQPVVLNLSIADLGDSRYDSSVFVDNIAFSNNPNCVTATGPTLPPPTPGGGGTPPACPGPQWYLAEGSTRPGIDEYLLLLNTATSPAA